MKKLVMLILALMLCVPALAEESTIPYELMVPVCVLPEEEAAVSMEDAVAVVHQHRKYPEQMLTRATLTETAGGRRVWVITIFDTATFVDSECHLIDAETGSHLFGEGGPAGQFYHTKLAWTEAKGPQVLWSLADKQLYDTLYALEPMYGLPTEGDMSAEDALQKALAALELDSTGGYSVGYGYLMGGEGYNGIWEICLVIDGQVDCQVNLDAVTGEVYYLMHNQLEPDEANG